MRIAAKAATTTVPIVFQSGGDPAGGVTSEIRPLLQSIAYPDETYVGLTADLRSRFSAHNAGRSTRTSKYRPGRLVSYVALSDERKAIGQGR
jgi:hypothetical protein